MRLNKIYYLVLCALLAGATSCGGGDDAFIPPAIEPDEPDPPTPEEVYNTPDFTPHVDGEPFDTYRGLVMAGYQGWFGAPGDGCSHSKHTNTQWYHYRENDMFEPGVLRNSIDFWPLT